MESLLKIATEKNRFGDLGEIYFIESTEDEWSCEECQCTLVAGEALVCQGNNDWFCPECDKVLIEIQREELYGLKLEKRIEALQIEKDNLKKEYRTYQLDKLAKYRIRYTELGEEIRRLEFIEVASKKD